MRDARFTIDDGRYAIELHVIASGSDVVLHLDGGDRPHVGAVSLATYVKEEDRVTMRSLVAERHREDEVTERVARAVAQELHCTAAVLAGIHYDELDQAGIDSIRSLADEAGSQAIAWVRSGGNRR